MPGVELIIVACALGVALLLRPWRMLVGGTLVGPLLAWLVLLPWVWAAPTLGQLPLKLHWSGACLALLMLGWPLAVLVCLAAAATAGALAGLDAPAVLALASWQGVVPATLALALGAGLRRWLPANLFVYTIGRAFLGSAVCLFAANWLAGRAGHAVMPEGIGASNIALWLMAWADAVVTGMLAAIFVGFKPAWLATWSDHRYLGTPRAR